MIPAILVVASLASAASASADDFSDPAAALGQAAQWTKKARDIQRQAAAVRAGRAAGASASADGCVVYGPDMDVTRPVPPLGVAARMAGRDFPSAFMAWHGAENLDQAPFAGATPLPDAPSGHGQEPSNIARHDLAFFGPGALGLKPVNSCPGLAVGFTADSVARAMAKRAQILAANPRAIVLAEIRWHDGRQDHLPADSPWWKAGDPHEDARDGTYRLLNVGDPGFRAQVARQCKAAVLTGVFDGCMFDWWIETDDVVKLARAVREAIGDEALIVVNSNNRRTPASARDINGLYMEGFNSPFWPADAAGWTTAEGNVQWAEQNLRAPAFAALEGWETSSRGDYRDVQMMRALTALALVKSRAFVLFGDKNTDGLNDHRHDWYPFWDKGLGRPKGDAQVLPDGGVSREYDGGTVVYNPPANRAVTVRFPEPRTSRASRLTAAAHAVAAGDGDIFTKPRP